MIKTIPMWKIMMITKGRIVGSLLLAGLFTFIVVSVPIFIDGLQSGETHQAIVALAGLLCFGACALVMLPSKKYVPGKTFSRYRNKHFTTQIAIKYGYVGTVILIAVFVVLNPKQAFHTIGMGLVALGGLYAGSKSLKFHRDVDFSASEYLATALGFSTGEKILVSYQNFDAGEVKAGSNAFAATATKLIVASFDGHAWKKLSRDLSQISHIGILPYQGQDYFVMLKFNDGSDALLSIGLFDKLTSHPVLVVRKLLESIDASLLGERAAPQVARRSRVVAAPETTPDSTAATRHIEFTPDTLTALQNAEEVVPGRRLEI
ncbi:hypothetical protein [Pseudomonas putida]|uniref:Uncharacterized protein n=1 Tax=Pseudomonas putida TaxID=303 RepID=A0A177SUR9_PSEPU|nr:hypothetical protein [Pseudomonas putida]OAI94695.1 hypothetical protein AYO28_06610 [Pseudomonas putida]